MLLCREWREDFTLYVFFRLASSRTFSINKIKNFENNACIGVRDYDILLPFLFGGIAQLVERLNGIQKVRGSTPLTSTIKG